MVWCRNFSLVALYSLKFTRCSLLFVKSLVPRWKIYSLLVVEVARCKIRSLLVAKFRHYSLQKLLVAKNHSLLVAKFACYSLQKLLVSKNHSLQNLLVGCCKNSLVTHCTANFDHYLLCKVTTDKSQF